MSDTIKHRSLIPHFERFFAYKYAKNKKKNFLRLTAICISPTEHEFDKIKALSKAKIKIWGQTLLKLMGAE